MYPDRSHPEMQLVSDRFWPARRTTGHLIVMRSALVLLAVLTSLLAYSSVAKADSPPNLTTDIPWTVGQNGVNDIEAAYNNARRQEESQLGLSANALGNLTLPPQATWDTYSDDQKATVILNAERLARIGMTPGVIGLPFTAIEVNVDNLAQGHADYLLSANTTGHTDGAGNSPFDRIDNDPVLGPCHEFLSRAENIAYFWTSGTSNPLYIERSIYGWIYDDAGSAWGHREAALLQDKDLAGQDPIYGFKNNVGSPADEGYIGIGVAESASYNPGVGEWVNWGTIVVMNMIDPTSTGSCPWDVAQRYPLVLSIAGTGSGTVGKQPDQSTYLSGTEVILTATPATGSIFSGWSGDADCGDGMVTMDGPRNCTATFLRAQTTFTLTVVKTLIPASDSGRFIMEASGTAGVEAGDGATASATVNAGETVTFGETAGAGTDLANYSTAYVCDNGGPSGSTASGSMTMPASNVTCIFTNVRGGQSLSVSVAGTGAGTVTSNPAGINCGASCNSVFPEGTQVILTATPAAGSIFSDWSGDADCADGMVTMDGPRNCTASFASSIDMTMNYLPVVMK